MGKTGGFLEFERKNPGYRDLDERVKDHLAVERMFTEEELRAQAARCMSCGTPFCHGTGCPLGNIIPEFNHHAYKGKWDEALRTLISTASFPEFTGRLCPAPCETACVLDGTKDVSVSIRQIELSIIEKAFQEGLIRPAPPPKRYDKRVAVIGSGPAGLAVADYLNKAGYPVVVYDSATKPGGIMRYGIPDFKMEKWVIDRRIDLMKREGVEFEMGVEGGDDVSCKYLMRKFAAVALCCGSRVPRDLNVPGRELAGIHFAMDFLVRQNQINANEPYDESPYLSANEKSVVVIGGGDTGSDCIGTSVRQGARKIYQLEILPKPPETRPDITPWPDWPNVLRSSSSHYEGGERRWSVCTKSFTGENGAVKGLNAQEVEWEKAADGRYVMKEKIGTEFHLQTDLVLLAVGFAGPIKSGLVEDMRISLNNKGNVTVNEDHMTSAEGVFAAGDMVMGQSLIVKALADARLTAQGIIRYLQRVSKTSIL
jgi:glutamate synthase (NADPH/NADH) small chain